MVNPEHAPERLILTEDGEIKAFLDEARVRAIAREEIASLCGLVLGRFDQALLAEDAQTLESKIRSAFGEALRDFGGTPAEPGKVS